MQQDANKMHWAWWVLIIIGTAGVAYFVYKQFLKWKEEKNKQLPSNSNSNTVIIQNEPKQEEEPKKQDAPPKEEPKYTPPKVSPPKVSNAPSMETELNYNGSIIHRGEVVKKLQHFLNVGGYASPKLSEDGVYGKNTKAAHDKAIKLLGLKSRSVKAAFKSLEDYVNAKKRGEDVKSTLLAVTPIYGSLNAALSAYENLSNSIKF